MRYKYRLEIRDIVITDRGSLSYCGLGYFVNTENDELVYVNNYSDKILYKSKLENYCKENDVYNVKEIIKPKSHN